MKKAFILILGFLFVQKLMAQSDVVLNYQKVDSKRIHFGFTLGFNTMDFQLTPSMQPYGDDSKILIPEINVLSPGFHVSVVSDLKINEVLNLRFLPGISLGQRSILFYNQDNTIDTEMKIESTYIDLPLSLKYRATRISNLRPYFLGGVNFKFDMARNKEFNEDEGTYIKLTPFDVCGELGFGIDFYLAFFKFSTEIKYSVGTLNNVSPDAADDYPQYANSINNLKSRMLFISFHFE